MELLEREHCLQLLGQWLDGATQQAGVIVLVSGEAGVGKSALIGAWSRRQRSAKRVLYGACDALFTPRPLGPLHDIARQLHGQVLATLTGSGGRDAVFSAVLGILQASPTTLMVFEDVHWADEATLDLLKFLGRRIHLTRAMLVLTYRADEVRLRHPLRQVLGDLPRANVRRLSLAPLSEAAVARLAKQVGRACEGLYAATGGNPFFVTEVLAANVATVPTTVRDAVLARIAKLSRPALEIAELTSIVPGKVEGWLLESVASPAAAEIEECSSAGMIQHEDGSLAFRHELARRALEDSLPAASRQRLHAAVLGMLEKRSDVSAARLAHHAHGARNSHAVLRYAPIAAEQAAAVGAHREAVAHLQSTLQHADGIAVSERAELLDRLSYECYLTDQIGLAIEARSSALQIWRGTEDLAKEGDSLRWLSRLSWFAGRREPAKQHAIEAIAVLERLPPSRELAMAYSNRAQLEMLAHDSESAVAWAQRAIELAKTFGDVATQSHALNNRGSAYLVAYDPAGWADLRQSLSLALTHGLQEHAARAYTNLSSMATAGKRYTEALEYFAQGVEYCELHDLDSWRLYMLAMRSRARLERSDWDGAAGDADLVLQHPQTAPVTRIPALITLAHLRIRRGDPGAGELLEEARSLAVQTDELQRMGPLACALAEAAWLTDDAARIVREVRPVYESARKRHYPWLTGELASWLWRAGALAEIPSNIAEPYALEMAGDAPAAARAWARLGCRYEEALALASSDRDEAQCDALRLLDALGASATAQALRRRMRARGVRRIPRGVRTSTRTNQFGLTRREAQVLALLADGLHNSTIAKRLFLSTKTVDRHVSAMFRKLNVTSREAAAALARELGADNAAAASDPDPPGTF